MITIKIGTAERSDGDIDANWIQQQVNSRRKNGEKVCVHFGIHCGDSNLNLISKACMGNGFGGGGGTPRNYSGLEQHLMDEWKKAGFFDKEVNAGMVVSYWKMVKSTCN